MKKLFLLFLNLHFFSFGQYSNYYGTVDVNANVNVNKNVDVSGNVNVNKTITSIDYGALAAANATRARNRIEALKIQNEKERAAMIAIAGDPSKAFDYGRDNNWKVSGKNAKNYGFRKFTFYHKLPHESLFSRVDNGYNYQNISENGIETLFVINGIFSLKRLIKVKNYNAIKISEIGLEDFMKRKDIQVGKLHTDPVLKLSNAYIHKKDLNRATVFGLSGYVTTIVAEDDYEFIITDRYVAQEGDRLANASATFKADKDEVDFEELEGRRFYFRKLIQRTIGSAQYIDLKD
jgi:hypothetical protein